MQTQDSSSMGASQAVIIKVVYILRALLCVSVMGVDEAIQNKSKTTMKKKNP